MSNWRGSWRLRDGTVGIVLTPDRLGTVVMDGSMHVTEWDEHGNNCERSGWDLVQRKRECEPTMKQVGALPQIQGKGENLQQA